MNAFQKKKEIKELKEVLEDLNYSLIECEDPLLRSGIQTNIDELSMQIASLEGEELL